MKRAFVLGLMSWIILVLFMGAGTGIGKTAATNASCSQCHADVKTVLPPKHVAVKGESIVYCLPCHKFVGDKMPNAFSARLHRAHAASADCSLCHAIATGKSFTVTGEKKSLGAFSSEQLELIRKNTVSWAESSYLDNLHGRKQLNCTPCHGKSLIPGDTENDVNARCITCHGTLDKIAAKSTSAINPHKSHLGEIGCTVCHHGHAASKAYCLNCHTYKMPIPGGGIPGSAPATQPKAAGRPESIAVPKGVAAEKTDVVIIGAGAAGFTAAITAHDAGARVIVLEKQPIAGGNSLLAAGGMNAAGTRFQTAKGIKDTMDMMFKDTMEGGKNMNEPELVRILAANSVDSLEWLISLGADLSDVGRLGGASVSRAHRPKGGSAVGAHIVGVLKKNADKRKIDIRTNSKVVKIIEDKKGNVTGVVVQGKHRNLYTIQAKAVINAAGGFSANPEKVAFYRPEYAGMTTSNQPGATGDGLDIGTAAGGKLRDMEQIQIHPTVAAGSRILITEAVRGNGAILVNREGWRFVNELTTRDAASAAILKQTGKSAFLVFDETVRKSLKQIEGYFHLDLVKEGGTLTELASKINVPASALTEAVERYNGAVAAKNDGEFKRPDLPLPLKTAKFYAIEVIPGIHYTMGGLKINALSQVIGKDGRPIPGFYAAGEVSGGVHGANRLGGNSISQTITYGRIAGTQAAKFAKVRH